MQIQTIGAKGFSPFIMIALNSNELDLYLFILQGSHDTRSLDWIDNPLKSNFKYGKL